MIAGHCSTLFFCFFFILNMRPSRAGVENGIVGDPRVHCGDAFIEVEWTTRSPFTGLVFVEDHLEDAECRSAPIIQDSLAMNNASIRLPFKGCGVEKRISTQPRGIFLLTSLIVSFHPDFLTKTDRVYVVQCFYMEMESTLEREIQVNMKPPPLQTSQVPMPICRYEVLEGSPQGPPVFYAKIGQQVYHKWTCEAQMDNQFCMLVHTCVVNDGRGDRVELIDTRGCARDKHLLQNLEYISDLMAGREAHVYHFADRQSLFFDCQITLTVKEPGTELCPVPTCPDPPRRRRQEQNDHLLLSNSSSLSTSPLSIHPVEEEYEEEEECLSTIQFGSMTLLNLMLLSSSGLIFFNSLRQSSI